MKLMNRIYKIKNKMMLSFMAIILLALFLISISSYYLAAESIKHNASEYNDTIMKRLGDNIEYYFDYMESISNIAVANNDILDYLRTDTVQDSETEKQLKEDITEYFDSMLQTRSDIYSIIIFGNNNKDGGFLSGYRHTATEYSYQLLRYGLVQKCDSRQRQYCLHNFTCAKYFCRRIQMGGIFKPPNH